MADIGAGTGRDAQQLLQVLPHGRVLAIDGSQQMLAQLRDGSPASWTGSRSCRPICASRCRYRSQWTPC